jgi:NADH dehydrogenase (ubiquinone) Fe-S protein 6
MSKPLPEPTEILHVDHVVVPCDGGPNPALGHPRVFLNIEAGGMVDCPYCGRRYILKEGAKAHAGH